jgi:hypothetical protein
MCSPITEELTLQTSVYRLWTSHMYMYDIGEYKSGEDAEFSLLGCDTA